MRRHVELRDMRSLERPSLYKIFAPLDPEERLPRELLLEGRRYRSLGRTEVAGALWLPVLWILLSVTGWFSQDVQVLLGIVAIAYALLWVFALSGRKT